MKAFLLCAAVLQAAAALNIVDVFVGNGKPVPQYRIPALVVTGKGTLLAFAEARYHPETDCGYKYLVVRRSEDQGVTWSGDLIVAGFSASNSTATGNPMVVYHAPSSKVVMVYAVQNLPSGLCSPSDAVFAIDDGGSDGLQWGQPRNITAQLGPIAGHTVPGPGAGAVLSSASGNYAGRIVMSGTHGVYGQDIVFYSDDAGQSWTPSTSTFGGMDESATVELVDGSVLINMRNDHQNASCDCRGFAVSSDHGATFSEPVQYDPTLIEPVCQGSIMRIGKSVYFANPASKTSRSNITVRRGTGLPGGWSANTFSVLPGAAWGGYTSITGPIDAANSLGGIVFEHENATNTLISFAAFPLDF